MVSHGAVVFIDELFLPNAPNPIGKSIRVTGYVETITVQNFVRLRGRNQPISEEKEGRESYIWVDLSLVSPVALSPGYLVQFIGEVLSAEGYREKLPAQGEGGGDEESFSFFLRARVFRQVNGYFLFIQQYYRSDKCVMIC